jgi:hypothetical protein
MYSPLVDFSRLVMAAAAAASFFAVVPAVGQVYYPIEDLRMDGAVAEGSMVIEGQTNAMIVRRDELAGDERSRGWDLGLVLGAAYDDNIFLSADDARSDFVIRVGPSVEAFSGNPEARDGGFYRVAYRPTGVIYTGGEGDDRIDQDVAWAVGWRGAKAGVGYRGGWKKLGEATADTGRETDRTEWEHVVQVAWSPSEKMTYEISAGRGETDYDDDVFIDSAESHVEAALRYSYSPKTELSMAFRASRLELDGSSDQDVKRLTAGMSWQPRQKVRVKVEAGAEWRSYENGSDVTPVVEARVDWEPKEGTNLFLTGYHREETSAFFAGQNYQTTGASAGVSQRLGDRWRASLEGGVESVSYRQVSGAGAADRDDRLWFIRPALQYRLSDDLGLEFFYRAASSDSSQNGFGYDQNTTGVRLDYQF